VLIFSSSPPSVEETHGDEPTRPKRR
jgi:hypothetical protein